MPETWRDIPIRDMGPMLRDCCDDQDWTNLWQDPVLRENLRDNQRDNQLEFLPRPDVLMVYLQTVCIAASQEFDSLDDLLLDGKFERIFVLPDADRGYGGFKYYLKYIVSERGETNYIAATRCFEQIKEFIPECRGCRTLGELLEFLMEKNNALQDTDEQRNISRAEGILTQKLDEGALFRLWRKWPVRLDRKINAIPAAREVRDRLEHGVKQIVLNGAPGTGKTYMAKLLAERLGSQLSGDEAPYTRVQFHPSYDYTDFVEGLRPVKNGEGNMQYVKLDGHFKKFCRRVEEKGNPKKQYYFLIDEINRADLSKVLGELMYCLEADKRGPENRVLTQYQNLPTFDLEKGELLTEDEDIFAKGFYIPANVYIIGTMNDIDRSVESMDFALRRRFEFKEVVVDRELLQAAFKQMGFTEDEAEALSQAVDTLNEKIRDVGKKYGLSRQYFISQGQFANLAANQAANQAADQATDRLEQIKADAWKFRIEPLLREYLRGESEGEIDTFIGGCRTAFGVGDS